MSETKFLIKTAGRYFRDFSIVVAGIAVTLCVNSWIVSQSDKKDLKQYLTAIKLELEENVQSLDYLTKRLHKSINYSQYLQQNYKKALDVDSLIYYAVSDKDGSGWAHILPRINIKTNSFEMFKASGAMRQISDKNLLSSIWNAYFQTEYVLYLLNEYYQIKKDELFQKEEFSNMWQLLYENKVAPSYIPMQKVYMLDFTSSVEFDCVQTAETLRETIAMLDKML